MEALLEFIKKEKLGRALGKTNGGIILLNNIQSFRSKYSLDNYLNLSKKKNQVSQWTIVLIKFQIGVTYFFAGIAKVDY